MHFDNGFSIFSSKSVILDYTVTKPILGLAPELFYLLVVIVVVVIVAVIATYALKKRKPAKSPSNP